MMNGDIERPYPFPQTMGENILKMGNSVELIWGWGTWKYAPC